MWWILGGLLALYLYESSSAAPASGSAAPAVPAAGSPPLTSGIMPTGPTPAAGSSGTWQAAWAQWNSQVHLSSDPQGADVIAQWHSLFDPLGLKIQQPVQILQSAPGVYRVLISAIQPVAPSIGAAPAPIINHASATQQGIKPSGIAHGGADIGWQPDMASAIALAKKILGPQGFTYVSSNPTQPYTFTVVDNGPNYQTGGGGHTFSAEFALPSSAPTPSFFVPPSYATAATS